MAYSPAQTIAGGARVKTTKRTLVVLALTIAACAKPPETKQAEESPTPTTPPPPTWSETVAEGETRLHEHFMDVLGKTQLKPCLARVGAKGLMHLDLLYNKSEDNWARPTVTSAGSSLPKGKDEAALKCFAQALSDDSFAVVARNSAEAEADTLIVRWTWPVPVPKDRDELAARISTGGPGGPEKPVCSECKLQGGGAGYKCVTQERGGYPGCKVDPSQPNVCSTDSTKCFAGTFGMAGGAFIY